MDIKLHKNDLPKDLEFGNKIAVDCEFMGLNFLRDKLCLVQISTGKADNKFGIPIANAKWAITPRRVSDDRDLLCCNHKNKMPKIKQTKTTPKLMPIPNKIPMPAPSNELWAIDSP